MPRYRRAPPPRPPPLLQFQREPPRRPKAPESLLDLLARSSLMPEDWRTGCRRKQSRQPPRLKRPSGGIRWRVWRGGPCRVATNRVEIHVEVRLPPRKKVDAPRLQQSLVSHCSGGPSNSVNAPRWFMIARIIQLKPCFIFLLESWTPPSSVTIPAA